MVIYRGIAAVKPGSEMQMVGLMQEVRALLPDPKRMRIYYAHPAGATPGYQVGCDVDFESLAALEKWMQEWSAMPGTADWFKRYEPLLQPGTGSTIWILVE